MSKKKKVLITGGAGFIGSHVCDRLIKEGYQVICMDNLITGKMENISHLLNNSDFEFIQQDVTKHIDISGPVDYVLHLASPASPVDYLNHPIKTSKAGSLGTHNALGVAKAKKSVFVFASTSEVYGDPLVHPQTEQYWGNVNILGPRGCYDEAKRFGEALTMAYHRVHKLNIKIARIFNTYGERMRQHDGRVIPNFIAQALGNKPLTVYGMGLQTRSFCYVGDLVDGLYKLMLSKFEGAVNIGNPHEITVKQLAVKIIKMTNSKSKITYKPMPQDDPKLRCPDIKRVKRHLGWSPKISLEEGLKKTIIWFKNISQK